MIDITFGMLPVVFGRERKSPHLLYPYTREALSRFLATGKEGWHPMWDTPTIDWEKIERMAAQLMRSKSRKITLISIYATPPITLVVKDKAGDEHTLRLILGAFPIYSLRINDTNVVAGIMMSSGKPEDHRDILIGAMCASASRIKHWVIYRPHNKLAELIKYPHDMFGTFENGRPDPGRQLLNERLQALVTALSHAKTLPAPTPSWRARTQMFAHTVLIARERFS